jgi:hypothetical protein
MNDEASRLAAALAVDTKGYLGDEYDDSAWSLTMYRGRRLQPTDDEESATVAVFENWTGRHEFIGRYSMTLTCQRPHISIAIDEKGKVSKTRSKDAWRPDPMLVFSMYRLRSTSLFLAYLSPVARPPAGPCPLTIETVAFSKTFALDEAHAFWKLHDDLVVVRTADIKTIKEICELLVNMESDIATFSFPSIKVRNFRLIFDRSRKDLAKALTFLDDNDSTTEERAS